MDPSMLHILHNNLANTAQPELSSDKVAPVAVYNNADTQKELVLKENRGKSGIYRWTNKETGKSYVGSSVNLSKRLSNYLGRHG